MVPRLRFVIELLLPAERVLPLTSILVRHGLSAELPPTCVSSGAFLDWSTVSKASVITLIPCSYSCCKSIVYWELLMSARE